MAGLTLSAFDKVMKIDYLPPIREALNQDTKLYDYLEDGNDFIVGRHAYIPHHISRNEGHGARAEGGTLPTPGNQGYTASTYTTKYIYGRIKVTGPVLAGSRDEGGAFTKALDSEISGMVKDMRHDMNRMAWGWGDGLLATSSDTNTDSTIFHVITSLPGFSWRNIRVGMKVDVINFDTDAEAVGSDLVTAIDKSNGKITLTTQFTSSNTNVGMYRMDTRNIEPVGIGGIIDDVDPDERIGSSNKTGASDVGSLDRGSNSFWKAQELDNSGTNRALTIDLLQEAEDQVDMESNGEIACWFTTHAIRRKYGNMLIADRRYPQASGSPRKFDGGYSPSDLSFNDVPVRVDKFAHTNRMYGIPRGNIYNFLWSDFDWMDKDGSILHRPDAEDAYLATLFSYREMGTGNANEGVVIKDLSE